MLRNDEGKDMVEFSDIIFHEGYHPNGGPLCVRVYDMVKQYPRVPVSLISDSQ